MALPISIAKFEHLKASGDLPSPKGVALAIIRLIQDEDSAIGDLARVIKTDPAFVGRLIKAANGLAGYNRRAIASVQEALLVLGLPAVRTLALGFSREFVQGDLAGFRLGDAAFLLQDFFVPAHASNLVMHLTLDDLGQFWARLQAQDLVARYGVRAEPPQQRPWGLVDMTLTDPSGVLWRIAQRMESDT